MWCLWVCRGCGVTHTTHTHTHTNTHTHTDQYEGKKGGGTMMKRNVITIVNQTETMRQLKLMFSFSIYPCDTYTVTNKIPSKVKVVEMK